MSGLIRTKQGKFSIDKCYKISDIESGSYKLLDIREVLDYKIVKIADENLLKKVTNGVILENIYNEEMIMFEYDDKIIAIYKLNLGYLKPYKMFL